MSSDHLQLYLSEIERGATVSWPERNGMLAAARDGNEDIKKALIQATLMDTARIAISCREPEWMLDLDKIQEANLVLMRAIDDTSVTDLHGAIRERIPAQLRRIARDFPNGPGSMSASP